MLYIFHIFGYFNLNLLILKLSKIRLQWKITFSLNRNNGKHLRQTFFREQWKDSWVNWLWSHSKRALEARWFKVGTHRTVRDRWQASAEILPIRISDCHKVCLPHNFGTKVKTECRKRSGGVRYSRKWFSKLCRVSPIKKAAEAVRLIHDYLSETNEVTKKSECLHSFVIIRNKYSWSN